MSWKYVKCYNKVNAFSDWRGETSLSHHASTSFAEFKGCLTMATVLKDKLCRIQRFIMAIQCWNAI